MQMKIRGNRGAVTRERGCRKPVNEHPHIAGMPKVQGCRGGYAQSPRCLALAVLLVCMSLGSTTASTHSCGDGEKIPIDRVNDGYRCSAR